MKSTIYYLLIILFSLGGFSTSQAQVGAESRMGSSGDYWIFGLNAGFAWQSSDISPQLGGGWGFYLGKSIWNRPQSIFSVDGRFRYMGTWTYGQNLRDTLIGNRLISKLGYRPDSLNFAHNHETVFHDLAFELRLNFEELRRKHSVLFALYGGLGLGIYNTGFDQRNIDGALYNYEDLDFSQPDAQLCDELDFMRDGIYETRQGTKLTLTPTIGLELGYWFSPHFALAIGHRTTFTLTDKFDGVALDNSQPIKGAVHHYTSLNLHWRLYRDQKEIKCPEVNFTVPIKNSQTQTVKQSNVFLKAIVKNVKRNQITYTVNGEINTNYSYSETNSELRSSLSLKKGTNIISIKGKNRCGVDAQQVTIIYNPDNQTTTPTPTRTPPTVKISNPINKTTLVYTATTTINATILNVTNNNSVTFTVNGVANRNFSFSGNNFSAYNVPLQVGTNTISVTGVNKDGTDSKTISIIYKQKITPTKPKPVVSITYPQPSPYTTTQSSVNIKATILNVSQYNNVTFMVNGQRVTNFSFSGTSFSANNIYLQTGNNTLVVKGKNDAGEDAQTLVVIYNKPTAKPPVVNITNPSQNPYTTQSSTAPINAIIYNVDSRNGITFTVNGAKVTNFYLAGTSFSATISNLRSGANSITISGRNSVGQDTKTTVIVYNKPVTTPRPIVNITTPNRNPYNTTNTAAEIRASIQNVASKNEVTFTVNGQITTNFSYSNGAFRATNVELIAGNNIMVVSGRNSAGQDSKSTTIIYNKPVVVAKPVVTITTPNRNPYNTTSTAAEIRASIQNVASKNEVTFTVNGQRTTNFSYSNGAFRATNVELIAGANIMVVLGRNSAGQDSKSTTIFYSKPVVTPKPIVTISTPNRNPYNTTSTAANIKASIQNVASKNEVTFTINGQRATNFSYSNGAFKATNIELVAGANIIVISGRNSAGQDSKSTTIVYSKPVVVAKPVVTITTPNRNPYNTTNTAAEVRASIQNVASKNEVTFTVNGQRTTNFSYSNGAFKATNIELETGANIMVVLGRNSAGQDSKSTTIIYSEPVVEPAPIVRIYAPDMSPANTRNATEIIRGNIRNVANRNGVTFTVNGQSFNNFTYNNGAFTATGIPMKVGKNTLVLTGRNTGGQDSKTVIFIYTKPVVIPAPVVTITSPSPSPHHVQTNQVNVRATVKNVTGKSAVSFSVNGQNTPNFTFVGDNFSINGVVLRQGKNILTINGVNATGQDTKSTIVIYTVPVAKPAVTINVPSRNPFNVTTNISNIVATVKNVASKNDITFTVNGQAYNNFTFKGQSFSADKIELRQGNNTFTITGRNSSGQDTKSTIVIYTQKTISTNTTSSVKGTKRSKIGGSTPQVSSNPKPVVTITSPAAGSSENLVHTKVTATILNVRKKSQIVLKINGVVNTNFSFKKYKLICNSATLNQGNNTISITATNSAGQDSKSTTTQYGIPRTRPNLTIQAPTANQIVKATSVALTVNVIYVVQKSDLTVKVNGVVTPFTFAENKITTNLPLRAGSNTIEIFAQNRWGRDLQTVTVTSQP